MLNKLLVYIYLANQWFDKLEEPKRSIYFSTFVFVGIISLYLFVGDTSIVIFYMLLAAITLLGTYVHNLRRKKRIERIRKGKKT